MFILVLVKICDLPTRYKKSHAFYQNSDVATSRTPQAQIPDCERENICGVIEILINGTWGRREPPQQDAEKWILLVGGKPIAAVDSSSDVSPEKRVALLASSSGNTISKIPEAWY